MMRGSGSPPSGNVPIDLLTGLVDLAWRSACKDGLQFTIIIFVLGQCWRMNPRGLAVVVCGLLVVAPGLVDHGQPVAAVVHVGKAYQEIAGGLLRLVELSGMDEINRRSVSATSSSYWLRTCRGRS